MPEYDDLLDDELTEGDEAMVSEEISERSNNAAHVVGSLEAETAPSPPVSIIKTPEDVPEALERMTGTNESFWYDRMKTDREWLARRVGKKK